MFLRIRAKEFPSSITKNWILKNAFLKKIIKNAQLFFMLILSTKMRN